MAQSESDNNLLLSGDYMQGLHGHHSYKYGFDTGDHFNPQQRYEEADGHGNVKGSFRYMDGTGHMVTVFYKADKNGFYRSDDPANHKAKESARHPHQSATHHNHQMHHNQQHAAPQRRMAGRRRGSPAHVW